MITRQETVSNGIEWWLRPCGRLCHSLSVMSSVMARLQQHLMTQKRPPVLLCGHPLLYIPMLTSLAEALHNYCTIYKHIHLAICFWLAIGCLYLIIFLSKSPNTPPFMSVFTKFYFGEHWHANSKKKQKNHYYISCVSSSNSLFAKFKV